MSKRTWKIAGIAAGSTIGFVLALILIVPLLISVEPHEGLSLTEAVARNEERLVTIPFTGTDGIELFTTNRDAEIRMT